jgi:peptidoglycan/LPS O-acetylase OafA/YrhL
MGTSKRFTYIDGLRGLAIALVIITHAASITELHGTLRIFTVIGSMGVQLFFVISAFTIFYTLSKSEGSPTQFRDFFIKRLFRILPVYWSGIILYTIIYGLGSRGWLEGPELWHYPFHILLINDLHPETSSSVVPGGWSISCEVLFYMLVPLLFVILNNRMRMAIFFLVTGVCIPILTHYLKLYSAGSFFAGYSDSVIDTYFYRWIPNQLVCFGFGILLFKIYKEGSYVNYIQNKKVNLLFTIICSACIILFRYPVRVPQAHISYSLLFMVLALLLSVYPWKLYVNRALVYLGKVSFSSYLLHFLVLKQVTIFIGIYYPELMTYNIIYFVIVTILAFLITVPLASISYHFIEKRAVDLGKLLIGNLDKKNNNALSR